MQLDASSAAHALLALYKYTYMYIQCLLGVSIVATVYICHRRC